MCRSIQGILVLVFCFSLGGCGNAAKQHEDLADDALKLMGEFVAAVESIKDPASAKGAATKIDELSVRMDELRQREQGLPKLSVAENNRLEQKVRAEAERLKTRLEAAIFPAMIKAGPNGELVGQAMKRLADKAKKMGTLQ